MSPDRNWFGVTVDAFATVVVEFAVAQCVLECARIGGI